MTNWFRVRNLIGETAREIGILLLVFAPMEAAFADAPANHGAIAAAILFAAVIIWGGIILESRT